MAQELTKQQREAARLARNAYYREWRRKNKDKVKLYNAKYWAKRSKGDDLNATAN